MISTGSVGTYCQVQPVQHRRIPRRVPEPDVLEVDADTLNIASAFLFPSILFALIK